MLHWSEDRRHAIMNLNTFLLIAMYSVKNGFVTVAY